MIKNNKINKTIQNTKEEILGIIENEKCIISLVGKNATFKTELLDKINNHLSNDKKYNVLFFKAETTFNDEYKEKVKDTQFIKEIRKFLNNILSITIKLSNNDDIKKINYVRKSLEKISCETDNINNDEYFILDILNSFKLDENIKEHQIKVEILNNDKNKINDYSSGQGMYSLLKLCYLVIKNHSQQGQKTILIIDEPEKHCHKTLIKKIFNMLYELYSLDLRIIFATHSDYLLSECVSKFRSNETDKNYIFYHSKNNIKNISNIFEYIKKTNRKEQEIIVSSLFDENIILVEGLKDYEFLKIILSENELNSYYCSIYDCGGKTCVKKIKKIISNLDIDKNVRCIVDADKDSPIDDKDFYEIKPDLETAIEDPKFDKKSDISFYSYENLKNKKEYKKIKEYIKNFLDNENGDFNE